MVEVDGLLQQFTELLHHRLGQDLTEKDIKDYLENSLYWNAKSVCVALSSRARMY